MRMKMVRSKQVSGNVCHRSARSSPCATIVSGSVTQIGLEEVAQDGDCLALGKQASN